MSVLLHRVSNCLPARDGRIMRCGIIRSCQSAASSEIVKRCCMSAASIQTFTFTFTLQLFMAVKQFRFNEFCQKLRILFFLSRMLNFTILFIFCPKRISYIVNDNVYAWTL